MEADVRSFGEDSHNYARFRPQYPKELYDFLVGVAPSNDRAWDCASGTGVAAVELAHHFREVVATDINATQLAEIPPTAGVRVEVCSAEAPPFPDDYVDLVCVAQAIHWFDLDRFYSRVTRVLRPRGVLACWGYGSISFSHRIDEIVAKTVLDPIEPYWSAKIDHISTRYTKLDFPFHEIDGPEIEMKQEWTLEEALGYMSTWSAYKRFKTRNTTDLLESCRHELRNVWPRDETREAHFNFFHRVGRLS